MSNNIMPFLNPSDKNLVIPEEQRQELQRLQAELGLCDVAVQEIEAQGTQTLPVKPVSFRRSKPTVMYGVVGLVGVVAMGAAIALFQLLKPQAPALQVATTTDLLPNFQPSLSQKFLTDAQSLAKNYRYKDALTVAGLIPQSDPSYPAAQKLFAKFADRILAIADADYQLAKQDSDIDRITTNLKTIPQGNSHFEKAKVKIEQLRNAWKADKDALNDAKEFANKNLWKNVLSVTDKVKHRHWIQQAASLRSNANSILYPPISSIASSAGNGGNLAGSSYSSSSYSGSSYSGSSYSGSAYSGGGTSGSRGNSVSSGRESVPLK